MAVQEWVSTMEERIRKLGGQGVERFLSNLFRAFEGMFLGTDTPKNNAEEVLNTLQSIREISAVSMTITLSLTSITERSIWIELLLFGN